jgi:hypothetical protein
VIHHESEHFPEPEDGWVFESPYVDALMEIGREALHKNAEAVADGAERVGEGLHDFSLNERLTDPLVWAEKALEVDPAAWSSYAQSALFLARGAEDDHQLMHCLEQLGAVVAIWLTDVNGRAGSGAKR